MRKLLSLLLFTAVLSVVLPARALCTSDGLPQPAQLLERFINADCLACWKDPATPRAGPGVLALDWIVPGGKGDDAPLSAVAADEAMERLYFLKKPVPERSASVLSSREGDGVALRLAQGDAFNDYVGTSIELKNPGRSRWHAWLLLVERLPAGVEGSPVERNVVRNVFRPDWGRPMARSPGMLAEDRPMQIHEGARAERLRLIAVLHDGHGRMRAITQTECSE